MEVETLLEIAAKLSFLSADTLTALLARTGEIGRMTNALIASLDRRLASEESSS
jgi:four helix bundle protein